MERNTQQRKAIVHVIDAEKRPLSVQEILDLASSECPGLGIATVYRNVRALVEDNKLIQVEMPGGLVLYEKPGEHHHHHFACTSCQKVFDIFDCGLNLQTILPSGFRLETHEILLSGFCDKCQATNS